MAIYEMKSLILINMYKLSVIKYAGNLVMFFSDSIYDIMA